MSLTMGMKDLNMGSLGTTSNMGETVGSCFEYQNEIQKFYFCCLGT